MNKMRASESVNINRVVNISSGINGSFFRCRRVFMVVEVSPEAHDVRNFTPAHMPTIQREPGLNLPNVMTPGAWVIVAVVLAAIAVGIGIMLWRVWQQRTRWRSLEFLCVQYYAQDASFSADFLRNAIDKARAFLILNGRWSTAQTDRALVAFNVYVYADDVNAGKPGLYGYEKDGVIGTNRKLTTLCHEMGHLLHERLEKIADYNHERWMPDGFTKAE